MRAFDSKFAAVYNDIHRFPSIEHVAKFLGVSYKTVKNRAGEMRSLRETGLDVPELISRKGTGKGVEKPESDDAPEEPVFRERKPLTARHFPKPRKGVRRFILTSAQDESLVHEGFLANLEAYAEWLGDCQIMVAGFTYNKSIYDDRDPRPGSKKTLPIHYHERVRGYLTHDQIQLGDKILFCGEMNTLPTAVSPLSGFETYTRDKWGIFPHAKVQQQSIPTAKKELTKQIMTTGCVTKPNYVQKKAGIKASFDHIIAAVIVELMDDGTFFCRHLIADTDNEGGGFYDLDRRIENGSVEEGVRVEALTYGDIHHEKLDPEVALTTWGYDTKTGNTITAANLLDHLKPAHQFFHDLSDFAPRNHHNIGDPHFLFKTHHLGTDNVCEALMGCARFLEVTQRDFCRSVVVQSNHDNALLKWLKTADYRDDPANAVFFLHTQLSYYRQLEQGIDSPPIFEQTIRELAGVPLRRVQFVSEDDSYIICGDIENAMHGHLGANGARGNPRSFVKMGRKTTTGHTHSPERFGGAVVVGVSGSLDQGYNKGLSSWVHAHAITYQNGQRTIISMMNGRWFAPLK